MLLPDLFKFAFELVPVSLDEMSLVKVDGSTYMQFIRHFLCLSLLLLECCQSLAHFLIETVL
jgi:hypothetical protein